jgi:hypothetical protein
VTGQGQQNAYNRGAVQGATQANILEEARNRRNQNLALASITPDMVADPTKRAALTSLLIQAGRNPQQTAEAQLTTNKLGLMEAMEQAQQGGAGIAQLNPQLAIFNGKPVETSRVEGNTLLDPYETPAGQAAVGGNVPTSLGQAMIGTQGAAATADMARAGASNAQAQRTLAGIGADKAGNYDIVTDNQGNAVRVNKLNPADAQPVMIAGQPLAMQPKGAGAGGGSILPSATDMKQALGEPKVGGQPNADVQDFLAWQALKSQDDPAYKNGQYALQQYVLSKSGDTMAKNQTQGIAQAMGLTNVAQNRANATGQPVTDGDGQVVATPTNTGAADIASAMAAAPPGGSGTAGAASKAPAAPTIAAPTTQSQYDALPKGTTYRDTDGSIRVKGGG